MPWYPDQFRSSTAAWCWQEKALYRALLDAQWALGALPSGERSLAHLGSMDVRVFRRLWKTVKAKFQSLPDGTLQNYRLEQHRLACLRYKESKRLGARLTNAKRWQSDRSVITERVAGESPPSPSPSPRREEHPPTPLKGGEFQNAETGKRKPRSMRNSSRAKWRELTPVIDHVRGTATTPQPLTWNYVQEHVDPLTWAAIERTGGCLVIAERDRFTSSELEARFREAYESMAEQGAPYS